MSETWVEVFEYGEGETTLAIEVCNDGRVDVIMGGLKNCFTMTLDSSQARMMMEAVENQLDKNDD